jgi:putative tricarboxylic transport membrane protein
MHENKMVDIYSGLVLIAFSIAMFISSFSIEKLTVSKIGSDFSPRLVAVLVFVLSIILVFNAIRSLKAQKALSKSLDENSVSEKKVNLDKEKANYVAVLLSICLIIVYLFLMPTIGFLITTALYLFCQFNLMALKEKRKPIQLAVIAIITSVSIYFLFKNVFYLMLPAGILG